MACVYVIINAINEKFAFLAVRITKAKPSKEQLC